jgi:hypothetical protein
LSKDSRGADSEEKREPASDIDTVVVDSLKALDPNRPIREADIQASIAQPSLSRRQGTDSAARVRPNILNTSLTVMS